jgi:hypothetical protein
MAAGPKFFTSSRLWLTARALRSFERVNLDVCNLDFNFPVSGEVAEPGGPFLDWGRGLQADRTDSAFCDMIATFAHFNHVLAAAAFAYATVFTPESTFCTGKNCLTLHGALLYL